MKTKKSIQWLIIFYLILLIFEVLSFKVLNLKKFQKMVQEELNFYQLSSYFYGNDLFYFYNNDQLIDAEIIETYRDDNYFYCYQNQKELYLALNGVVSSVRKINDTYEVSILTENKKITYGMLLEVNVSVYQKIDSSILLGSLDYSEKGYGYYYYYN